MKYLFTFVNFYKVVYFLLSFDNSLCTRNASPFSAIWFASIFFWFLDCLYKLLTTSFIEKILLILMKSNLLCVFSFMENIFDIYSKNTLFNPRSWRCSVFSFTCFVVSCFMIHFELIVYATWSVGQAVSSLCLSLHLFLKYGGPVVPTPL